MDVEPQSEAHTLPDDLTGRWHLTDWSLALDAWNLHIALCIYPPPLCFDKAREYEAKRAAIQAQLASRATPKPKKPKAPPPKEQLGLWDANGTDLAALAAPEPTQHAEGQVREDQTIPSPDR